MLSHKRDGVIIRGILLFCVVCSIAWLLSFFFLTINSFAFFGLMVAGINYIGFMLATLYV